METHNIDPIYDSQSRILILGSFPSVRSREAAFFYANPQNRFWRTIAAVANTPVPEDILQKKQFLRENRIALWDVIASCDIRGSSDASIANVVPNDLSLILDAANIRAVFCNGKKAYELYRRYSTSSAERGAICLPSTSPANASWSTDRLIAAWAEAIGPYLL